MQYYHAHRVDEQKCRGHMACMRRCPTQAIRVRHGRAQISEELCVDCGLCLSACPEGAVVPMADQVTEMSRFAYKAVVPSPVLYAQFGPDIHPYIVHLALRELGFDEVADVSASTAALAAALAKYLETYQGRRPLISSHCPSTLRLIQVKYPDLVELIVPLDVPREVTARELRRSLPAKLGLAPEQVGIIYLAPCPAKIVSIKQPAEKEKSYFDGAVAIRDVYPVLLPHVVAAKRRFAESQVPGDYTFDPGWATTGALTRFASSANWLAVAGIDQVMRIFDDIENSKLRNVDFVEAMACMMGCIGGPFVVENPYVARATIERQRERYVRQCDVDFAEIERRLRQRYYFFEHPILPRPTRYFDTDIETSIKRIKERERVYQKLRQIDCGCCGAPTCLAFAEDFVRGEAELTDCIFLRQQETRVPS